ncbi:hypothetical protein [Streptomyces hirsutus]|uniref:hypothetical protein n=1 Tax=Streptomyces hirsutus TaxID=35620 RepID=UPI00331A7207
MRVNLLAMHLHTVTGGQPAGCTCTRAVCGGAEQGPGIPVSGCTAHGTLATHHHAFDCPQLPTDTDLTRLHILVVQWTKSGPVPLSARPFDRALLAELRDSSTLWDVAEGDTAADAIRAWQDYQDALQADADRRHAAYAATVQERTRIRTAATAALRSSTVRAARRMLAADYGDGQV